MSFMWSDLMSALFQPFEVPILGVNIGKHIWCKLPEIESKMLRYMYYRVLLKRVLTLNMFVTLTISYTLNIKLQYPLAASLRKELGKLHIPSKVRAELFLS